MPAKKKPQYVFARFTTMTMIPRRVTLHAGEAWHATDPVVSAHPDWFTDEPPEIKGTPTEAPVEQATAAPGEKRATRRAD